MSARVTEAAGEHPAHCTAFEDAAYFHARSVSTATRRILRTERGQALIERCNGPGSVCVGLIVHGQDHARPDALDQACGTGGIDCEETADRDHDDIDALKACGKLFVPGTQVAEVRHAQAVDLIDEDQVLAALPSLLIIMPARDTGDSDLRGQMNGAGMIHDDLCARRFLHITVVAVSVGDSHRIAFDRMHGIAHVVIKGVGQDTVAVFAFQ